MCTKVLVSKPANLGGQDFSMTDLQVITRWSSAVDVASNAEVLCARHARGRLCDVLKSVCVEGSVDAVLLRVSWLAYYTINCNHSRPFQINKLCDTRMTWRISDKATKSHEQETIDCVSYNDCFSSLERKSCRIHHIEVIPHSFGVHSGICIGCV